MKCFLTFYVVLFVFKVVENASFRCDYKFNNATNGWMKFHEIPATWFDARVRCSLEGGTIASPSSSSMRREMAKTMKYNDQAKKQLFTGLHATVAKGAFYTIEGISMLEFKHTWAQGEPDNVGNYESCLTMNVNGELSDFACGDTFAYICYKSNNPETKVTSCGTIDEAYTYFGKTKNCYKFHVEPRNFSRADFACSAEGGHLAIINSEDEANFLKQLYNKHPYSMMVGKFEKSMCWIGFHDWGEKLTWRTIFGQTLKEAGYAKFSPSNPNNLDPGQQCGAMYYNSSLNDYFCNHHLPFICEKNPKFPEVCTNSASTLRADDKNKNTNLSSKNNNKIRLSKNQIF